MKAGHPGRTGGDTPRSIASRLTLGLAAVTLLVFSVVGSLLLWSLQRELLRAEREDIDAKLDVVRHFLEEVKDEAGLQALPHHLDDLLIGHGRLRIWLVADDGTLLYGGKEQPRTAARADGEITVWREDGVPLRGTAVQVATTAAVPAAQLIVGYDVRGREHLLRSYRSALLAVCGLGTALIVGLGAWVARTALAPVHRLSREAGAIAPNALSVRLSPDGAATELRLLVESFNRVLDRVQMAYDQLHAFSADVAHELRTPLATLISGAEVTLARARSVDELREALASNLDELQQLAGLVNDMLFLAKADRGDVAQALEAVDLRTEAQRVLEYFEAALEDRAQAFEVRGDASVPANAALLRRALVNLVSNASRYTPAGGTITITITEEPGAARIAVRNPGPSIAPHLLPRLFDRFFRADAARQRSAEHHGLGLAIVQAVARMHGGDAFATSAGDSTEIGFTVSRASTVPVVPAA